VNISAKLGQGQRKHFEYFLLKEREENADSYCVLVFFSGWDDFKSWFIVAYCHSAVQYKVYSSQKKYVVICPLVALNFGELSSPSSPISPFECP